MTVGAAQRNIVFAEVENPHVRRRRSYIRDEARAVFRRKLAVDDDVCRRVRREVGGVRRRGRGHDLAPLLPERPYHELDAGRVVLDDIDAFSAQLADRRWFTM